jgi:hypothetical protein
MALGNVYEVVVQNAPKIELSCAESFFLGLVQTDSEDTTSSKIHSGRVYDIDLSLSYAIVKCYCSRAGDLFSGKFKFQVREDLERKVLDELPDVAPSFKNRIFLSNWI